MAEKASARHRGRPHRWRLAAAVVVVYALVMLWVHSWPCGLIATLAVMATKEALDGP